MKYYPILLCLPLFGFTVSQDLEEYDEFEELPTEKPKFTGGRFKARDKLVAWDPNYCNDTKLQETAGLRKTALGQFLGYDCDSAFYHCRWGIDGWRTYKKMCRTGLVYDTSGTQNCNYDFNVEGCNTHNSCADCFEDQYSCCLSEECVDQGQRCDGKYDCVLEEDEQNCPTCSPNEFPCVLTDKCIPLELRCNGIDDCGGSNTDELNCDVCDNGFFYCANSQKCVEAERRCDGVKDCSLGEDEVYCHRAEEKPFLCRDQVNTIPMSELCDGIPQCPDQSDEAHCEQDYVETDADSPFLGEQEYDNEEPDYEGDTEEAAGKAS